MEIESYITGLTEGEGCFCVSFNQRKRLNTGIEVRPSFSISQNKKNLNLMKKIQSFFICGSIRFSKRDNTYKYEVRSIDDLINVIIPHFIKYPLIGIKATDFQKFAEICKMIRSNLHRSKSRLEELIDLAYEINLGKRRYKKDELLRHIIR